MVWQKCHTTGFRGSVYSKDWKGFQSRRGTLGHRARQGAHQEQTIAEPLEFSGVGLHSGAPVTMRLLPAPAGSGIVFRRTDLDNFEIPATGRNVAKVSYATSLMRQSVLISTTEHLLSALIGMGVDNVIVEIDNLELPILDGSALPYVEAFQRVGIREQRRKRETIRMLQPVEVREGDKFIGVYPGPAIAFRTRSIFPRRSGSRRPASIWRRRRMGARLLRRARLATRPMSASCATWG
jgi:UDP-3-O-[3-hydroxymyristoyl] N-acetylglucosamine deacetylase